MTKSELEQIIRAAVVSVYHQQLPLIPSLSLEIIPKTIGVEQPRNKSFGQYATNIALQLAKEFKLPPLQLAEKIANELIKDSSIENVQTASPGFININLVSKVQNKVLSEILGKTNKFGWNSLWLGKRINLEFVSANPTGPIHLGGTRWAAVGDALGRIFTTQGAAVTREYYFNDHGSQIDKYALSLIATADETPVPEGGYAGEYIKEIAAQILVDYPQQASLNSVERQELFRAVGVEIIFAHIKQTLVDFRTKFDVFTHENSLFSSGKVAIAIDKLKQNGNLYLKDGAWWLKSSKFGDDKDRVVIKSNGEYAYLAGDIAYYLDKKSRGFDLCIYMLGADHHGYIARLKAAVSALGEDPNTVEVLIGQMVNLIKSGQPVRMSKRAGNIITLDDLVAAVGVDAARYTLIRAATDLAIDLDLDLITKASSDNPVYYVQYAHARLCSILRTAADYGMELANLPFDALSEVLTAPAEGELVRTLANYPSVVARSAALREPHRICHYLEELASVYHKFYNQCRVLPYHGKEPQQIHFARLMLCSCVKQVLANGLDLLGVVAPEKM